MVCWVFKLSLVTKERVIIKNLPVILICHRCLWPLHTLVIMSVSSDTLLSSGQKMAYMNKFATLKILFLLLM